MTRIKNRACALLLALALLLSLVPEALAAEVQAEATTVQMTKTEGTVGISNSSGRSISLIEKMRLYNGYHVETDEASYAWINLDRTKLSKLDAVSEMELRKSGKKLELLLNEGNLFFNVTEPLEDDESLNIRTSTIVVGIRGTCGWVKIIDQWRVEVYVLEGTVTITVTDPVTGQTKEEPVSGGEKVTCVVYPQDKNGDKCEILRDGFDREDIDGFVLVELAPDEPLVEKIYEETGIDLRDWPENPEERLKEDQEKVAEKLREIEKELEEQDEHISVDPVWPDPDPTPTPEPEPEDSGEEEPSPTPAPIPSVTGIAITPSTLNLYLTSADGVDRSSGTLRAVETLSDGSTRPASGVAWSAATRARSAGSPVTVVSNSDGSATVTATGVGSATVTGTAGGYSAACTVTIEAVYSGGVTPTPDPEPGTVYMVTFDANGGNWGPDGVGGVIASTSVPPVEAGGTVGGTMPEDPVRDGYVFSHWNTAENGTGADFTADTPVTANITLYAQWEETWTWSYNETTRTLTISGRGDIDDFFYGAGTSTTPWSDYLSQMTTVEIEEGITNIGKDAFAFASRLTSVTIPDSVTSIGDSAFDNCSRLSSVTIPDSVTSLGYRSFYACRNLTSIILPDSITSIGDYSFYACALTSVTIPAGVTNTGIGIFSNSRSLTNVTIPDGLTSIDSCAFQECSSLMSINIPDSVTNIGDAAFEGCSSLADITIPDSVTSIGYQAFHGCGFTNVTIPDSVVSIGDGAFAECRNLTSITIPDSVISIGDSMFIMCSSLTSATIPDGITSVNSSMFSDCSSLTSVTIPDSVTSIGSYAFERCSSLTDIDIPASVTSIGESAFNECSSLTSITIPNGVTSINDATFERCYDLSDITIPDSVTSIGASAFSSCSSLTTINFSGTKEQWNAIAIGDDNYALTTATINHTTPSPAPPPPLPYSDVPLTASYAPAVLYCREHELMNGTDATHFTPDGTLTRAMMVTVLHRLAGTPAAGTASAFPDVASGQWYTQAVSWANSKGIVLGYPDGTFGVSDPVTHEQVALIFQRYSGGEAVEVVGAENPSAPATRAEIAATLMNYAKSGALSAVSAIDVMCAPSGIVPMKDGTILVTDTYHKQLWKVNLGAGTVYAGGDTVTGLYGEPLGGYNDASLLESYFKEPWAVAPFLDGWAVSDTANNVVRLVRTKDTQTLNGRTSEGLTVTKLGVAFDRPTGLATDGKGNLYVSDTGKGAVRKITPEGRVTTMAKGLDQPMGLCWKNGVLYIAETGADRVVKLQNGQVTVVASGFNGPQGVAVGDDGAVYVADTSSGAVRMVCNGEVTTLVERDTAQVRSGLTAPRGLLVQDGRLYICDGFARKIFILRLG